MFKVTRIFMGNVGHVLAWYPGIDVPLVDLSGQPTHTIFNLINQGGKSTFLSMFFTIFDPDKGRFLQHLRNSAQRFEQYFDRDGQPGLVAVEWMMPGDLASSRKLVTGLIVVMKKSGELFEPDRFFFAFESVPGLSYDELPAGQLGGGPNGMLNSREDALRWLQQMETQHAGNFQRFSNQNEWRACLEGRGIDIEMLRRQVEFNRTEGGMGDAFLDFKTEYDFIRKFMTLTLNPETAEQTHATISTLCKRMGGRSRLVDAKQQLERFSQFFDPFALAAAEFHEAHKSRREIEVAVARAYATFGHYAVNHRQSAEAARRNVVEFRTEARKADQLAIENEGMSEAYRDVAGRRLKDLSEKTESAAKAITAALDHKEKLFYAAQLRKEIIECHAVIGRIQENIDRVTRKQIAPLKAQRDREATILTHAIQQEMEATAREIDELDKRAKDLDVTRANLKAESGRLKTLRESAITELNRVKGLMESAQNSLARLRAAGVVETFETCDDAHTRLSSTLEQMAARADDLGQQIEEAQSELVTLKDRRSKLDGDVNVNAQKVKVLQEQISTGEAQRERLAHLPVLCRAAGAEVADVDSEVLEPRLRDFIRGAMEEMATANLRLSRLKEDQSSIVDTRLAGRDPDVSAVVQFLANAGVKGVQAFPHYLAEVLPDANAARETVLSNPARFLGVTVPIEAVEQARTTIGNSALRLIRPVVVSAYAVEPALPQEGLFTVPSSDDSAYNHAAARRRGQVLEAEIESATGKRDEAVGLYEEARSTLNDLVAYVKAFGDGRLDALKAGEERLLANNEALRMEIETIGAQVEAMQSRQVGLAARKVDADNKVGSLRSELISLVDHIGLHESFMPEWEATQARATADAQRYADDQAAVDALHEDIEPQRRQLWNAKNNAQQHVGRWQPFLAVLAEMLDSAIDVEAELAKNPRTTSAIYQDYERAVTAVESVEQESTRALKLEIDVARRDANKKESDYGSRYPQLTFAPEDVNALLCDDMPARLLELRGAQAKAEDERDRAMQLASDARADYAAFVKQRRHRGFTVAGIEGMESNLIGQKAADHAENAIRHKAASASAHAMASESEVEERKFTNFAVDFEGLREIIQAMDIDVSEDAVVTDFLVDAGDARNYVREHEKRLRKTKAVLSTAFTQCTNLHDKILSLARDDDFAKVDVELAIILRDNSVEATINDYRRLQRAAQNRRDTIENELASMDGDMARGTDALLTLTTDGLRILTRATDMLKLPDSVPVYGGKGVLKMTTSVGRLTSDQRREVLSIYMDELSRDGNIPESGAALAAACVHRLAPNRRLDLKVLKLVSLETQQYVPVDGLSNSGAEKISMALFLYFIIAKLRYEQRADSRSSEGGILVLDNPFSTATARSIWETILGLADAMKIQLLLVTGIKEYDVLSVFKRFVRLKKIGHNTTKGRIHVGIVDYQFKPTSEEDGEPEAMNA
ncbi:hypothetical protein [Paraburkholderia sp. BCC1884]|uniref:hypothetical protein n=1 Tax=Paraburkholderia sp. BCC1884 TaxID=2562668 RepID=UPI0011825C3C|nr:hypothetical protein [Paraburkholderia sp. BCC1884]